MDCYSPKLVHKQPEHPEELIQNTEKASVQLEADSMLQTNSDIQAAAVTTPALVWNIGSDVEPDNSGLVHQHLDMGVSHYWNVNSFGRPIEAKEVSSEEFWNEVMVCAFCTESEY